VDEKTDERAYEGYWTPYLSTTTLRYVGSTGWWDLSKREWELTLPPLHGTTPGCILGKVVRLPMWIENPKRWDENDLPNAPHKFVDFRRIFATVVCTNGQSLEKEEWPLLWTEDRHSKGGTLSAYKAWYEEMRFEKDPTHRPPSPSQVGRGRGGGDGPLGTYLFGVHDKCGMGNPHG